MPFIMVRNDIALMKADAIVNAANCDLKKGSGVCGAIFNAAGPMLEEECRRIGRIKTGEAVITDGCGLKAKYIIHTAGPVWQGGASGEEELLRSCYRNSLELAWNHKCDSVAIPVISSGIYGYPKEQALKIAREEIINFISKDKNADLTVYLVLFDKEAFSLGGKLNDSVREYIDDNYAEEHSRRLSEKQLQHMCSYVLKDSKADSFLRINEIDLSVDESFSKTLLKLIDKKGYKDAEVYTRANIDRRHFAKMRNEDYRPGKKTVMALSIALKLDLGETGELLNKAGFALSHSLISDLVIEYCIKNKIYDILKVNDILFNYDQQLLGSAE